MKEHIAGGVGLQVIVQILLACLQFMKPQEGPTAGSSVQIDVQLYEVFECALGFFIGSQFYIRNFK